MNVVIQNILVVCDVFGCLSFFIGFSVSYHASDLSFTLLICSMFFFFFSFFITSRALLDWKQSMVLFI